MFDIKWISANPEAFDAALARRGQSALSASLISLDEKRRSVIAELNAVQEKRNASSKLIGQAKAQKDEARAAELMAEVANLKGELTSLEYDSRMWELELRNALSVIPNLPLPEVPEGADENDNQPYFRTNESEAMRPAKPELGFAPKEHYELGEALGGRDLRRRRNFLAAGSGPQGPDRAARTRHRPVHARPARQ